MSEPDYLAGPKTAIGLGCGALLWSVVGPLWLYQKLTEKKPEPLPEPEPEPLPPPPPDPRIRQRELQRIITDYPRRQREIETFALPEDEKLALRAQALEAFLEAQAELSQ